jgi:hypothetical protein
MLKGLLKSKTFSLGTAMLFVTSLFATISPTQLLAIYAWETLDDALDSDPYEAAYSIPGWNITAMGTTDTYVDAAHGQVYFKGLSSTKIWSSGESSTPQSSLSPRST